MYTIVLSLMFEKYIPTIIAPVTTYIKYLLETCITSIWNVRTTSIFVSWVSTSPPSASPVSLLARDPCDLKHSCLLNLGAGSGPAFDLLPVQIKHPPTFFNVTKKFETTTKNYNHFSLTAQFNIHVAKVINIIDIFEEIDNNNEFKVCTNEVSSH